MKEIIIQALSKTGLKSEEIEKLIEIPKDSSLGDFAFPCFELAKIQKKNPVQIAKELESLIDKSKFEKVQATGPYLNFFLKKANITKEVLTKILKEKDKYGSSNEGKGKPALIEHTSINPNASPHMGRARNALIGDAIVRLLKFQGFKVETHYFVNDIGKQISMLVLGAQKKKNPKFEDLLNLYVQINQEVEKNPDLEKEVFAQLKKLEDGNLKVRKQFEKIVNICIKGQSKILSELDINYDFYDYESQYLWNKKMEDILSKLKSKGKLFEDNEGRLVLDLKGYDIPIEAPVLVLTRADKTSLYPLRDIAYTIDKSIKAKENNYIVLGEDQKTYFKQIAAALDILGYPVPRVSHYSFILLTNGKMSTRKGNVVLLEDFMNESFEKASEEIKKRGDKPEVSRAKAIAYSAIKYAILRVAPDKNVTFDLESSLSFEGNTGPYLLYSYARANSILEKKKAPVKFNIPELEEIDKQLVLKLNEFPEVVKKAYDQLAPNLIANYSYSLAQQFNEWYHSSQVIGSEKESFRLNLVKSFCQVLNNSLNLLGITPIKRM